MQKKTLALFLLCALTLFTLLSCADDSSGFHAWVTVTAPATTSTEGVALDDVDASLSVPVPRGADMQYAVLLAFDALGLSVERSEEDGTLTDLAGRGAFIGEGGWQISATDAAGAPLSFAWGAPVTDGMRLLVSYPS